MYKIIGVDGKEYGPATLEQLQGWVAQGRITPQTRVLAPGASAWKTASEIPELNSLLQARFTSAVPPSMAPSPSQAAAGQKSGLAITSLVLGILSFFCSLLSAIPAVICGHIALSRAKRSPAQYGGSGLAIAGLVTGYLGIAFSILIMPAMLLPALAKAKERAQRINCANNMKQIGMAFMTFQVDNADNYPFNQSTRSGGTLELCVQDSDGYDRNSYLHFMVMSNELSTPKVLVCPADTSKSVAMSFGSLQPANVSYRVHSGTNVTSAYPQEVLVICPIHGNVLTCDGMVQYRSEYKKER